MAADISKVELSLCSSAHSCAYQIHVVSVLGRVTFISSIVLYHSRLPGRTTDELKKNDRHMYVIYEVNLKAYDG